MNDANKIRIGWIAFCFVLLHFAFIVVYALPEGWLSSNFKSISVAYVSPVFEQKWNLFVPCPIVDQNLEIKYFFQNDSTDWLDVNADAKKLHSYFRLTHHGELTLGESNLMCWINSDFEMMNISLYHDFPIDSSSSFKQYNSYYLVKNYVAANANFMFEKKLDSAFVRCHFYNVKTGENGASILPKFSWTE